MQPENKYTDDLEYLASVGFEKVPEGLEDIHELKSKIRTKTFSYNSGFHFGLISLLAGAFLGISVFFYVHEESHSYITTVSPGSNEPDANTNSNYSLKLDTLSVSPENFVKPNVSVPATPTAIKTEQDSTIEISPIATSTIISSIPEKITEAQIKYIPNSPVIFLHDLKITDYSTLYFRQNKFVTLTVKEGLDASYANASDRQNDVSILSPKGNYYLHQAISDAMNYFSHKEYNKCLTTLSLILEINPDDINCKFYSGMCYYYKKNYLRATGYFEDCIANSNNSFLNEALFYKACSLYYNGDIERARAIFNEIAAEGSFYSQKAQQFLKD